MRDRKMAAFAGLVALMVVLAGCGGADDSSEPAAGPEAKTNAENPSEVDRAEGRVAYKVSGMKKTASGAT